MGVDFGISLLFGGGRRSLLLRRGFLQGLYVRKVFYKRTIGRRRFWVGHFGDLEFLRTLYISQEFLPVEAP